MTSPLARSVVQPLSIAALALARTAGEHVWVQTPPSQVSTAQTRISTALSPAQRSHSQGLTTDPVAPSTPVAREITLAHVPKPLVRREVADAWQEGLRSPSAALS